MRRRLILFISILLTFFLGACSTFFFSSKPSYIKVNGDHFVLNKKPYFFVGANLWYGCYLGSSGSTGDRPRLVRELDHLKSIGIDNLRILGASEKSYIKNSLRPAIQIDAGVYNDSLLEGLDFLLSEMRKRNMHAVIFLNNYWEWSGGMAQYNYWAGDRPGVDPAVPKNNYANFMDYSASFYRNEKAKKLFLNYVYMILNRVNKFDGLRYDEDPTIMAWELANEPRPGRDSVAYKYIQYYYDWIDSTAQYIHKIDPNHLVTTGSEGVVGSLNNPEVFLKADSTKYINYLTFHLWPKNWGWFDAKRISETYPRTEKNSVDYIDEHIKLARELNKPIVMEEYGLPRDSEFYAAGTPTTARDMYYKKILGLISDSAAAGAPIAGSNVWSWDGEGRAQHPDYKWRPGDPFTGDPPQEPQGLNSIYDTDTSTIAIFRMEARRMKSLEVEHQLANVQSE